MSVIHAPGSVAAWPDTLRARDLMSGRIVHCEADTPRDHVARLMGEELGHCVVVTDDRRGATAWRLVTDVDVLRSAVTGEDPSAGELAHSDLVAVDVHETAHGIARRLVECGAGHAVVLDGARPVGVVSTLDLVARLAR